MLRFIKLLFAFLFLTSVGCNAQDLTKYVDPFIGTGGNGHTYPGATAPFGMLQPSPVTGFGSWAYCSSYVYTDTSIMGFAQTTLSGTGCADLGNILIMPVSGKLVRDWDKYRSNFQKKNEYAAPGYYSVYLDDVKTKVEITASERVAYYRMRFDGKDKKGMLIDLQYSAGTGRRGLHTHCKEASSKWLDEYTLVGYAKEKRWGYQEYYYVIKFNRPISNNAVLPQIENEKALRHVAEFNMQSGDELMAKIAISSVSIESAMKNFGDINNWDFDAVRNATKEKWNNLLARANIKGTKDQKKIFYTALYHAMLQPNLHSDVDGYYRNSAREVVKCAGENCYTTFSLWDTYRAAHPLYTIIMPERINDFVVSMLEQGDAQGYLPIWALYGGETHCMIGNHSIPVIVEAWRKGFRGFDGQRALNLMYKTQTNPHPRINNWPVYLQYGYYPVDKVRMESVSLTLENSYDDYAVAEMAKIMGDEEGRACYARRSEFFKNIYDTTTLCSRPRYADGSWQEPFTPHIMTPTSKGGSFIEATASQFTWHVQHDVDWLVNFYGGPESFVKRLDTLFEGELVHNQLDITGVIGQYAHGNEPCHHIPYLYTLAGRQDKTAALVRKIIDTQYTSRPDGLCGNEDCGQMSAWYLFTVMGFYPVNPVSCQYVLGAPQIEEIALNLPNGKSFTVKAKGLSRKNKYVERVYLNGKLYELPYITHDDIVNGGELQFVMTDKVKK